MDLNKLREEIDQVDRQLVELYEKRLDIATSIAMEKKKIGKEIYDPEREKIKLDSVASMATKSENKDGVRELFEFLMSKSRERQKEFFNDNK